MADGVFNIAKGRVRELYNRVKSNDPANSAFIVVLLKANVADATLIDTTTMPIETVVEQVMALVRGRL